ncbi:MAG: single-stranded DNA-binding protein [Clostridiales bacterium]|nr:single-stranded DNA-binding protein [Clostridiales bacterium]
MVNTVVLIGRLTKDPEVRYTQTNNTMVSSFTLAVNRSFVRQGEERQADFIPIVVWGKSAEFASKYFKKGMQVSVVGRIQTRSWDDQNGQKRYVTEVVASELGFAEGRREDGGSNVAETFGSIADVSNTNEFSTITDDDLPF